MQTRLHQPALRFGEAYRVLIPGEVNDELLKQELETADVFIRSKRAEGFGAEKERVGESWMIYTDEAPHESALQTFRDWKSTVERHEQAEQAGDTKRAKTLQHFLELYRDELNKLIFHARNIP